MSTIVRMPAADPAVSGGRRTATAAGRQIDLSTLNAATVAAPERDMQRHLTASKNSQASPSNGFANISTILRIPLVITVSLESSIIRQIETSSASQDTAAVSPVSVLRPVPDQKNPREKAGRQKKTPCVQERPRDGELLDEFKKMFEKLPILKWDALKTETAGELKAMDVRIKKLKDGVKRTYVTKDCFDRLFIHHKRLLSILKAKGILHAGRHKDTNTLNIERLDNNISVYGIKMKVLNELIF